MIRKVPPLPKNLKALAWNYPQITSTTLAPPPPKPIMKRLPQRSVPREAFERATAPRQRPQARAHIEKAADCGEPFLSSCSCSSPLGSEAAFTKHSPFLNPMSAQAMIIHLPIRTAAKMPRYAAPLLRIVSPASQRPIRRSMPMPPSASRAGWKSASTMTSPERPRSSASM